MHDRRTQRHIPTQTIPTVWPTLDLTRVRPVADKLFFPPPSTYLRLCSPFSADWSSVRTKGPRANPGTRRFVTGDLVWKHWTFPWTRSTFLSVYRIGVRKSFSSKRIFLVYNTETIIYLQDLLAAVVVMIEGYWKGKQEIATIEIKRIVDNSVYERYFR